MDYKKIFDEEFKIIVIAEYLYKVIPHLFSFAVVIVFVLFLRVSVNPTLSMYPTIKTGSYEIALKDNYEIKRGDILTFKGPEGINFVLAKRLIGLPGETIEFIDSKVYINGDYYSDPFKSNDSWDPNMTFKLSDDEYFFMGDNRNNSIDSRCFGPIRKDAINGKVVLIITPWSIFEKVIPDFESKVISFKEKVPILMWMKMVNPFK